MSYPYNTNQNQFYQQQPQQQQNLPQYQQQYQAKQFTPQSVYSQPQGVLFGSTSTEYLLRSPGITLQELFKNQDDIMTFLETNPGRMGQFFIQQKPQFIEQMVYYQLMPQQVKSKGWSLYDAEIQKIAYISSQAFSFLPDQLSQYFLNNPNMLKLIFQCLQDVNGFDPTIAGYFQIVIGIFSVPSFDGLWEFLGKNQFILSDFMKCISSKCVADIIIQLLVSPLTSDRYRAVKKGFLGDLVEMFCEQGQKIRQDEDSEVEENISMILCAILLEQQNPEQKHMQFLAEFLCNDRVILEKLFKKTLGSQNNFSLLYSLQVINELGCVRVVYPQLQEMFVEYLGQFFSLFKEARFVSRTVKTSYGAQKQLFGNGRLMLLKVFQNLLFWKERVSVLETIAKLNIFEYFLSLTVKYHWNNMIHNTVQDAIINGIKSENDAVIDSILSPKLDIINFIVENYKKKNLFVVMNGSKVANEIKKGNFGFLTKLGKFLDDGDQEDKVYNYFTNSQKWRIFVDDKLSLINEVWDSQLGEDQNIFNQINLERKWKSVVETTGQFKKLSSFGQGLGFLSPGSSSNEFKEIKPPMDSQKYIVSDPEDPKEIFLDMALNGCGDSSCDNKYCVSCQDNIYNGNRMTEFEVNILIKEELETGKIVVYPCSVWKTMSPSQKQQISEHFKSSKHSSLVNTPGSNSKKSQKSNTNNTKTEDSTKNQNQVNSDQEEQKEGEGFSDYLEEQINPLPIDKRSFRARPSVEFQNFYTSSNLVNATGSDQDDFSSQESSSRNSSRKGSPRHSPNRSQSSSISKDLNMRLVKMDQISELEELHGETHNVKKNESRESSSQEEECLISQFLDQPKKKRNRGHKKRIFENEGKDKRKNSTSSHNSPNKMEEIQTFLGQSTKMDNQDEKEVEDNKNQIQQVKVNKNQNRNQNSGEKSKLGEKVDHFISDQQLDDLQSKLEKQIQRSNEKQQQQNRKSDEKSGKKQIFDIDSKDISIDNNLQKQQFNQQLNNQNYQKLQQQNNQNQDDSENRMSSSHNQFQKQRQQQQNLQQEEDDNQIMSSSLGNRHSKRKIFSSPNPQNKNNEFVQQMQNNRMSYNLNNSNIQSDPRSSLQKNENQILLQNEKQKQPQQQQQTQLQQQQQNQADPKLRQKQFLLKQKELQQQQMQQQQQQPQFKQQQQLNQLDNDLYMNSSADTKKNRQDQQQNQNQQQNQKSEEFNKYVISTKTNKSTTFQEDGKFHTITKVTKIFNDGSYKEENFEEISEQAPNQQNLNLMGNDIQKKSSSSQDFQFGNMSNIQQQFGIPQQNNIYQNQNSNDFMDQDLINKYLHHNINNNFDNNINNNINNYNEHLKQLLQQQQQQMKDDPSKRISNPQQFSHGNQGNFYQHEKNMQGKNYHQQRNSDSDANFSKFQGKFQQPSQQYDKYNQDQNLSQSQNYDQQQQLPKINLVGEKGQIIQQDLPRFGFNRNDQQLDKNHLNNQIYQQQYQNQDMRRSFSPSAILKQQQNLEQLQQQQQKLPQKQQIPHQNDLKQNLRLSQQLNNEKSHFLNPRHNTINMGSLSNNKSFDNLNFANQNKDMNIQNQRNIENAQGYQNIQQQDYKIGMPQQQQSQQQVLKSPLINFNMRYSNIENQNFGLEKKINPNKNSQIYQDIDIQNQNLNLSQSQNQNQNLNNFVNQQRMLGVPLQDKRNVRSKSGQLDRFSSPGSQQQQLQQQQFQGQDYNQIGQNLGIDYNKLNFVKESENNYGNSGQK